MKILVAASEAFPFCKTGGLGDVVGALSQTFSRIDEHEVVLFLPRYRSAGQGAFSFKAVPGNFLIPVGGAIETASIAMVHWGKITVYFIENSKYFDRPGIYRSNFGDYEDNDERFVFFSRAVLEGAKFIGFKPDVIHCHDWQTAIIPAYLKTLYRIDSFYVKTAVVFTIHNIAYQGMFPKETLLKAGFTWVDFTPDRLEFYGGINFMKAGIVFSDAVTTVSPSYAEEIKLKAEFGRGLEGILKYRSADLYGIINGIDDEIWDPASDTVIRRGYDAKSFLKGKSSCKKSLQHECGLPENKDMPLAGVVSRLDVQKGLDLIAGIIPEFVDKIQFVILGSGDSSIAESFSALSKNFPACVFFKSGFDETLAHKIYAGSDVFLMPSRFEPCGLSQMIAMRYGSLPVVTRTGGLKDTVRYDGEPKDSNGFAIDAPTYTGMHSVLGHIVSLFKYRELWNAMVKNAMSGAYSWTRSAEEYLKLFAATIQKKSNL